MSIFSGKTASRIAPGWPEIAVAVLVYVVGVGALALWMAGVPDAQAQLRINVAGAANFAAGLAGLLAAWALRVRDWRAFGFRAVAPRWLIVAAGLGVAGYAGSFAVEAVCFLFVTEPSTQADFQAAAQGGAASLALLLFTGAVLGPVGEELVFRGVATSALARRGRWVAVIGSALLFAAVHGPSVIFFDALLMGLVTGLLFHRTRSIWPAIVAHVVYNGLHLLTYSAG